MQMEGNDQPVWYPIVHVFAVVFCIVILALLNSFTEHKRPQKKYIERSYRSGGSNKKNSQLHSEILENQKGTTGRGVDTQKNKVEKKPEIKEQSSSAIKKIKSNEIYFSDLVDRYKSTVLAKLERPESRNDVVIRYYSKANDKGKVYGLRKYGFYIHERPSDSVYQKLNSNSIYYGDDVSNEDIQLVAFLLVQSGVDLKKIAPSKLHGDWKSNAIEIGTDSLAVDLPPLSLEDIRKNWH